MEKYIPETYNHVIKMLEPVIEKYDLDKITIESLVRSSIEVEEQMIQPVTAVWRSKSGKMYSTKASNIKVSLQFALTIVFRLKTVWGMKDIWLGIAIIHMIIDSFISATLEIDEWSSITLISVYRLQHADKKAIFEYAGKICPLNLKKDITEECIDNSLNKLESWGCIALLDGFYKVNEIVTVSMVKGYN